MSTASACKMSFWLSVGRRGMGVLRVKSERFENQEYFTTYWTLTNGTAFNYGPEHWNLVEVPLNRVAPYSDIVFEYDLLEPPAELPGSYIAIDDIKFDATSCKPSTCDPATQFACKDGKGCVDLQCDHVSRFRSTNSLKKLILQ